MKPDDPLIIEAVREVIAEVVAQLMEQDPEFRAKIKEEFDENDRRD